MRLTLEALGGAAVLLLTSAWLPAPAVAQAPVRVESPWAGEVPAPEWPTPAGSVAPSAELLASRGGAEPVVQARKKNKDTGLTLMIVGGALFVGGLVIGDDGGTILAVAGVGIGAYGIYLYVD